MQSAISEIASADRSRHQSSPVSAGRSVSRELAAVREGCGSRVPGLSRCLERPPRTVLLIKKILQQCSIMHSLDVGLSLHRGTKCDSTRTSPSEHFRVTLDMGT